MNKFKAGDVVVYSHALYSSVPFEKGATFKVTQTQSDGNLILKSIDSKYRPIGTYTPDQFELVQDDAVLTPEEVFEQLRKGIKLQYKQDASPTGWRDCSNPQFANILNRVWRIKPEPEVIELNGKKYREIVE